MSSIYSKEFLEAFWSNVDKTSSPCGCWLWTGLTDKYGYGLFYFRSRYPIRAHRLAKAIGENIPIPHRSLHCAHNCPGGDNKACVLHFHEQWMTAKEHALDRKLKKQYACGDESGARKHPETKPRGDQHTSSKVSEEEVKLLRKLSSTGHYTLAELANKLHNKISANAVSDIILYKTWKHVL